MMPVLFSIGPFPIYAYGLFSGLAVAVAAFLAHKRAKKFGMHPMHAVDAVFLLFLSDLAGSRLFFIAQHADLYEGRWLDTLNLREGGLVWYGGFLLAFTAAFLIVRFFRWEKWAFGDFVAPVLAAGHAVGRLGCWMNGCCYGFNNRPVQLIESAFLAALAAFLWARTGKMRRPGDVFLAYVLLYACGRFALEFLRADQTTVFSLTVPQWTSLLLAAVAGLTWIFRHARKA